MVIEDNKKYYIVRLDGLGQVRPTSDWIIVTAHKDVLGPTGEPKYTLLDEENNDWSEEWYYWNGEFMEEYP